jgi:uncharacterized protein DUF5715
MSQIAVVKPPSRDRRPILQVVGVVAGLLLVLAGALAMPRVRDIELVPRKLGPLPLFVAPPARLLATEHGGRAQGSSAHSQSDLYRRSARAAALGLDRGLFTSSPGGVLATAARVAQWRPLVVREARLGDLDPNLLEAIVFVESGGRPNVLATGDPAAASGLTQIVAATGTHFLGMRVHLSASRKLTRKIRVAELRGRWTRVERLEVRRRRIDHRFSPRYALAGTVRYLKTARRYLGRDDLAVTSYHMGIGNLQDVIRLWSESPRGIPTTALVAANGLSYSKLYFGSAPDRHAPAWQRLAALGDMSRDYYWKVLAAKRVMQLWRHDRNALVFEENQQLRKSSAEEVLHPLADTRRFRTPNALAQAWRRHTIRAIPRSSSATHIAFDRSFGQMANRLGRSRRLYRGLRPDALAVLLFIGNRVHELGGARRPLFVTSAVRDLRYQRVLTRHDANAARKYSLHTTGYAFDIARRYSSRRQAAAFQFVLERLQTLRLIAYIKESGAIHIAVASHAGARLHALSSQI